MRAAFLQNFGILQPMKVGEEGIAAAIVALLALAVEDRASVRAALQELLQEPLLRWREALADITGVGAEIDPDPTGNPFDRLRVTVLSDAGLEAVDVVPALGTGARSIRVRTHQIEHGWFVVDPRSPREGETGIVAERLRAAIGEARRNRDEAKADSVQAWKNQRAHALRHWPDARIEAAP